MKALLSFAWVLGTNDRNCPGLALAILALALAGSANRILAQPIYTPYAFTNFAGMAGVSGSADGTGSAARFASPCGVAVDNAGNVYVADSDNQTIRKVTPWGVVTTLAGLAGNFGSADGTGSAARFRYPSGVAVDNAGNVYVADFVNYTIRKVTPAGVVSTLAGSASSYGTNDGTGSDARFGGSQYTGPAGVAVDSAGNVHVADTYNCTIRKVTPAGVVTTLAGQAGFSGTNDGTGSAAQFNLPWGVAVDSGGNVYVADTYNSTIRKVTPGGVVTTLAGLAGTSGSADGTGTAARFCYPQGVAVDSAGNVYVADSGNSTIRKVTPGGVVTTLAGLAGNSGNADGAGTAAHLCAPGGVAADRVGSLLYVADSGNMRISKGTPLYVPHGSTATATVVNGFVVGATLTSGGSGYTTNPTVTILSEGSGSNATAIATVTAGSVTGITITGTGIGYTSGAVIIIAPPPANALWPTVTQVMEVDIGNLYPYDNYQLEFAPVAGVGWTNLGSPFTPTATTSTQYVNVSGNAGFFRLRYVP